MLRRSIAVATRQAPATQIVRVTPRCIHTSLASRNSEQNSSPDGQTPRIKFTESMIKKVTGQVRKDRKTRERMPVSPLVQIEGLPMTVTMEDIRKLAREAFPQGDKSIREICFRRTPEFTFTGSCIVHMTSPETAKSLIDYSHRRLLGGNLMKVNYVSMKSGEPGEALNKFRSPELMSVADPVSAASRSVVIVGFPQKTTVDIVMGYLRTKNFFPIESVPDSVVPLRTKSMAVVSKFLVKFESESEAWRCVRTFHNADYTWKKYGENLKLQVSVVY